MIKPFFSSLENKLSLTADTKSLESLGKRTLGNLSQAIAREVEFDERIDRLEDRFIDALDFVSLEIDEGKIGHFWESSSWQTNDRVIGKVQLGDARRIENVISRFEPIVIEQLARNRQQTQLRVVDEIIRFEIFQAVPRQIQGKEIIRTVESVSVQSHNSRVDDRDRFQSLQTARMNRLWPETYFPSVFQPQVSDSLTEILIIDEFAASTKFTSNKKNLRVLKTVWSG